jgi:DNA-binding IclR family transcriptional regulator
VGGVGRRSRLPDAVAEALRAPAVTAESLARRLRVTPQAAARLLAGLEEGGVVREMTGRRSFRVWAVRARGRGPIPRVSRTVL